VSAVPGVGDDRRVFPTRPGHVVIPHPKKDLGTGLIAAIRKQASL